MQINEPLPLDAEPSGRLKRFLEMTASFLPGAATGLFAHGLTNDFRISLPVAAAAQTYSFYRALRASYYQEIKEACKNHSEPEHSQTQKKLDGLVSRISKDSLIARPILDRMKQKGYTFSVCRSDSPVFRKNDGSIVLGFLCDPLKKVVLNEKVFDPAGYAMHTFLHEIGHYRHGHYKFHYQMLGHFSVFARFFAEKSKKTQLYRRSFREKAADCFAESVMAHDFPVDLFNHHYHYARSVRGSDVMLATSIAALKTDEARLKNGLLPLFQEQWSGHDLV